MKQSRGITKALVVEVVVEEVVVVDLVVEEVEVAVDLVVVVVAVLVVEEVEVVAVLVVEEEVVVEGVVDHPVDPSLRKVHAFGLLVVLTISICICFAQWLIVEYCVIDYAGKKTKFADED